jgi:hypothetical protein
MRFGLLGRIVQIEPGSEGYALWQAGLIDKGGDDWQVEIEPTDALRSLFTALPRREEVYPVLVEFVLVYRYPGVPGFVDAAATARRLLQLGMTAETTGPVNTNNRATSWICSSA